MIRFYFGSPGCGKTTLAVKMALKMRRKRLCYLNFEHKIPGACICNLYGLGDWTFQPGSEIFIDESGIEFNSRGFKSLKIQTIAWLKKHRHYKCDLNFFSQSWGDTDKITRDMASELWYLRRIGPWTLSQRVYKFLTVDTVTQQIIDGYRLASGLWLLVFFLQLGWPFDPKFKLTFRPFYYRYFDSWQMDDLPVREFPVYEKPGASSTGAGEVCCQEDL